MIAKNKPARDKDFLSWAKEQGGYCCVCRRMRGRREAGVELHHYGERGIGQKGSDYIVARVCQDCHHIVQGKTRIWASKVNTASSWELIVAIQEDTIWLLEHFIAEGGRP